MTREEAIIYLKCADVTVGREPKTKTAEALEMAIKALEQEPVIGKIRAEIITLQNRCYALHSGTMCKHCPYECEYKTDKEIEE